MSTKASKAANDHLLATHGSLKGWVFHVRKNGKVLVDAAHGMARRVEADGLPPLAYDANTIVHIASIAKLICVVGVLRFIEEWNEIADHLDRMHYAGPPRSAFDGQLIKSVCHWNGPLSVDDKILPLLKPRFLPARPPHLRDTKKGLGFESVTIRQLLDHVSGIRDDHYEEGLPIVGLTKDQIQDELDPSGSARFDLINEVSVICAADLVSKRNYYSGNGYTLLGALIHFNAGDYNTWMSQKLFSSNRFQDIARRPSDRQRAARYYLYSDGDAAPGVAHPNYAAFSASGGYYTTARAICDWLDAVMQAEPILGRPILRDPQLLENRRFGVAAYSYGPFDGFEKNGGTTVGGGGTNARVAFLRSITGDRLTAFVQSNEADVDANPLLDDALAGVRTFAFEPTKPALSPIVPLGQPGLVAHLWVKPKTGGAATVSTTTVHPAIEPIGGAARRTNMLAGAGINPAAVQVVELVGTLELPLGDYKLRLTSDDGSILRLDGELAGDNGDRHAMTSVDSGWIAFPAGGKKLSLLWYNVGGGGGCYLEMIRKVAGHEEVGPVPTEAFHLPRAVPIDPHLPVP